LRSVDDAFIIYETICSKCTEWKLEFWCVSLNLKKTFDKLEYGPLFDALRQQNIGVGYLSLLASIYCEQTGRVGKSHTFPIHRGVKQGDIISPVIFNAGLEMALRRWKTTIGQRGIMIDTGDLLTNIRYADDLILYATSSDDICFMLEALQNELRNVGLHLNPSKTKAFTSKNNLQPMFLDIAGNFVDVMTNNETHKYLGRKLCAQLSVRSAVQLSFRVQCAWM